MRALSWPVWWSLVGETEKEKPLQKGLFDLR